MKRNRRGFTLIELLISIILMMILMMAATMVFMGTTDTVMIGEARITVYTNARYALDILENDLMGCLPFGAPPAPPPPPPAPPPPPPPMNLQQFWMENGRTAAPGSLPQYNTGGNDHIGTAADRVSFRALATVADTLQTCQITWELIPSNFYTDARGNLQRGDSSHQRTARTNRPLYTLIRRVRVADPANPTVYNRMAKDSTGVDVQDSEMCHYVLSFNLEYYGISNTGLMVFSQLQPSYFQNKMPPDPNDPLGNGQGPNDTTAAYRIPAIRVTIVVVEDTSERQERSISKVTWIPVG